MEQKGIPTLTMDAADIRSAKTAILDVPKNSPFKKGRLEFFVQITLSVACLLLIVLFIFLLKSDIQDFYLNTLMPGVARYWPNMLTVVVLLVFGFNLYTFRGYRRLWFGLCEILIGSGLGWYAINKAFANGVSDAIVFLIVALYLIGRGWINIAAEFSFLQINRLSRK